MWDLEFPEEDPFLLPNSGRYFTWSGGGTGFVRGFILLSSCFFFFFQVGRRGVKGWGAVHPVPGQNVLSAAVAGEGEFSVLRVGVVEAGTWR